MSDCIFCKIIEEKIPAKFEQKEEKWVAIHDVNPQAPTHILIIPREHIAQISDLASSQATLVGELIHASKKIAEKNKIKDYRLVFNNGALAGQSVFHIHLHLLAGRPMKWPPG